MNKCIYLKGNEPELTFNSAEHIIPAGIGGIMKLPYGMVSDQINNKVFSSLELEFIRNSPISLPRQFHGPGKRGSTSHKKASKSIVHIMINTESKSNINLGFIKLGKPIVIRQFMYSLTGKVEFCFDKDDGAIEAQLNRFIKELYDFKGLYKEILDNQIPNECFILGKERNQWYLAKNKNSFVSNFVEVINKIINSVKDEEIASNVNVSQVTCHQALTFNIENYFRVCAKIIFNFLALSKGQEFILESEFDPIRNWIINGGENNYVQLIEQDKKLSFLEDLPFPPLSHKIIISKVDKQFVGVLSLYGSNFEVIVKLCDNYLIDDYLIDGFICDWKSKKEFRLLEYINKMGNFA